MRRVPTISDCTALASVQAAVLAENDERGSDRDTHLIAYIRH